MFVPPAPHIQKIDPVIQKILSFLSLHFAETELDLILTVIITIFLLISFSNRSPKLCHYITFHYSM